MLRFCTVSTRLPGRADRWLARAVERLRQVAADHRLHDPRAVEFAASSVTTCLPSRSTVMRSAICSASSSACEMKIIDTPGCFRSRTRSKKYFFSSGVSARGRLVEDDHLGLVENGARDLDHLLLGGAEQAHGRRRRHVEIQRLQELLRGDIDAAQAVVEFLLAEEQVLRDRHGRHQAVLLEHHGDAEMARLERRAAAETSRPSISILPEVSGTTPAITLVSVDLPAPFSPTSAWISPRRRSKSTSSMAGTPA